MHRVSPNIGRLLLEERTARSSASRIRQPHSETLRRSFCRVASVKTHRQLLLGANKVAFLTSSVQELLVHWTLLSKHAEMICLLRSRSSLPIDLAFLRRCRILVKSLRLLASTLFCNLLGEVQALCISRYEPLLEYKTVVTEALLSCQRQGFVFSFWLILHILKG